MNSVASTAENEARRAASLRRIAIVLQDLPKSIAKSLLADLSPEARQRIRHEVANLIDVDPMERRRALESFTGSLRRGAARQQDTAPSNGTDEITLSHSAHAAAAYQPHLAGTREKGTRENGGRENSARPASNHSPQHHDSPSAQSLEFLGEVSDEDLLSLLKDEHPQTKAVVLSQIAPSRAAALLPRLGPAQRQDLLTRIGRLHTLPEEMLSDLASSFRSRVERMTTTRSPNPLQSLIDAYGAGQPIDPATAASHVPSSAAAVSPRLQAILAEMPSSTPPNKNNHSEVSPASDVSTDDTQESAADRLRRITRDEPNAPTSNPSEPQAATSASNANRGLSTDEIHQELVKLPPRKLCEALGRVETRSAILALCGLPNKVADAAIGCLPRAQANQVRQRLMAVGSLEIRDIDRAKEAVAAAAQISTQLSSPATPTASVPQPRVAVAM